MKIITMVLIMNYIIYHKYRNNKKRRNIFHIYNFSSSYSTCIFSFESTYTYVCMFFNVLLIVYMDRLLKWGWLAGSLADCQLFWLGSYINDINILTILFFFVLHFLLPPAPHLILTAALFGGRTIQFNSSPVTDPLFIRLYKHNTKIIH